MTRRHALASASTGAMGGGSTEVEHEQSANPPVARSPTDGACEATTITTKPLERKTWLEA